VKVCLKRCSTFNDSTATVNWRSFTEQYLDSCGMFRDAVLSILATIAKQERVRLSERTLAGIARIRAKSLIPLLFSIRTDAQLRSTPQSCVFRN
jgi:DNA invertase Pin-like site-specific DNA recombinase